ncbi:hypothetical protein HanXRQr2_Chr06g0268331 [Helianthus annuus]|uniref:Uncharacterized protein n=1 Tax=Helianthus annuus TaxID=4232 RepID=A0A9K3NKW8_HELAN|nr:hypothetical protein HanXRQr2_Chr06g0268331 [Helianthus annuus]KAJ0916203.1 hypothetical protein HanPSC8_Chr06g0258971 [Helianthus annuus]
MVCNSFRFGNVCWRIIHTPKTKKPNRTYGDTKRLADYSRYLKKVNFDLYIL